jgi:hypothetical protein
MARSRPIELPIKLKHHPVVLEADHDFTEQELELKTNTQLSPGPYRMNAAFMRLGRHERGIHVI